MATQAITTTCVTAADVRACTARVSAFRARVWPARRPALPVRLPVRTAPVLPLLILPIQIAAGRFPVRDVIEAAAEHFGVSVAVLLGVDRHQPVARQRQIAMFIAHKLTGRSLPYIGRHIGGRDHTTVLHGVRAIQDRIARGDVETITAVNGIVAELVGGAHV